MAKTVLFAFVLAILGARVDAGMIANDTTMQADVSAIQIAQTVTGDDDLALHGEECDCDYTKSNQSFFTCGIAMAISQYPTVIAGTLGKSTKLEYSNQQLASVSGDTLKRPPRIS